MENKGWRIEGIHDEPPVMGSPLPQFLQLDFRAKIAIIGFLVFSLSVRSC